MNTAQESLADREKNSEVVVMVARGSGGDTTMRQRLEQWVKETTGEYTIESSDRASDQTSPLFIVRTSEEAVRTLLQRAKPADIRYVERVIIYKPTATENAVTASEGIVE